MNKQNLVNIIKRIVITTMLVIAFMLGLLYSNYRCNASELTISDYEAAIEANNIKIEQCETIKTQLHLTAEEIRKQEFYDIEFVKSLSAKWHAQNNYQNSLKDTNAESYQAIESLKDKETKYVYIGDFKITHYCICSRCCGKSPSHPAYGITATGTKATPGRTIAVDSRKIPYSAKVLINGNTYVAEDSGGAIKGNRIDICVASHSEALQKGVLYNVPVYVVQE